MRFCKSWTSCVVEVLVVEVSVVVLDAVLVEVEELLSLALAGGGGGGGGGASGAEVSEPLSDVPVDEDWLDSRAPSRD